MFNFLYSFVDFVYIFILLFLYLLLYFTFFFYFTILFYLVLLSFILSFLLLLHFFFVCFILLFIHFLLFLYLIFDLIYFTYFIITFIYFILLLSELEFSILHNLRQISIHLNSNLMHLVHILCVCRTVRMRRAPVLASSLALIWVLIGQVFGYMWTSLHQSTL